MFCTNINIDQLEYKEPQTNRSGGKVVHVSTKPGSSEWKDKIRFQMSEDQSMNLQTAVWGLSTPLQGQDTSRRTLELTIESPQLYDFLDRLDEKNISTAVEKAPQWFKKENNRAAVEAMYTYLVKAPVKENAKATVRVKVKCGDYPTNIYVVDEKASQNGKLSYHKGGPEDLSRNSKCMVMVDTVGLWFMSRQFGMSLTASEIMVWPARRASGIDAFTLSNDTILYQTNDSMSISTMKDEESGVTEEDEMMVS
jgi:hypothetical protein